MLWHCDEGSFCIHETKGINQLLHFQPKAEKRKGRSKRSQNPNGQIGKCVHALCCRSI